MENNQFLIQLEETQYNTPDISKKGAAQAAHYLYSQIVDNGESAVKVAEMLKFVEETTKQLKEITDEKGKNGFVDLVRSEIEHNASNGKSFTTKFGTKFELFEASTKSDFSSCGDPIWNKLNSELQILKNKLKERESFLEGIKSATKIGTIIDPDTFEVFENVELYPPIKSSTSTYKQTMING